MFPILLLHGFPLDSNMWNAQTAFLRANGHTVFTPDLPGFGAASIAPAPAAKKATIDGFADEVHTFIQQKIPGGKAIVGGFSMGGYILLSLLRNYPEDVAAAMFIDTRPDADSPEIRATRLKSIDDVQKNGPATFIETQLTRLLGKKPTADSKRQLRELLERQPADSIIAAQTAIMKRHDQSDLLPELKIPVLIVVGSEDSVTPPSVAIAMQSHMPHAMLVQVVSAGHMSPIEQPNSVNAALQSFLATIKP